MQFIISHISDLKPDNVGFTKDGCLKLFDLGLATLVNARTHSSQRYKMSGYTGSLRYMAPEVALRKRYGEKVDVYSYGILLWQMARDRTPFNSITTVEEFMEGVVHRGLRPKLDKVWPSEFSSLLCSCWHKEAELRPSFAQIVAELNTFLQNYSIGRSGTKMSAASAADGVSRSGNTSTADSSVNANNGVAPLPPAPPTARRGKKISKGNAEPETQSTWF